MKKTLLFLLVVVLAGCFHHNHDAAYQYSTIGSFMQGGYEGSQSFADIRKQGDFGLGTFDGIDGELLVLDGKFYRIRSDGMVYPVQDIEYTPFAIVKFFIPDQKIIVDKEMNLAGIGQFLDEAMGTRNVVFAFKIEGDFNYVKARSIGRQVKPYKPFLEVAPAQNIFELNNTRGVLIGFYSPEYFPQVSPSKYHFHFLTDDRKSGGHVLDFRIKNGTVWMDRASGFNLEFPKTAEFLKMDLTADSGSYR